MGGVQATGKEEIRAQMGVVWEERMGISLNVSVSVCKCV